MSEQPQNPTPEKVIQFKIGENEREVKMTYGLLDELVNLVKDVDQIGTFFVDTENRNKVISAIISERSPTGKIVNRVQPSDVDIEIETVDELLAWAASHVTGFFIRSLTNLAEKIRQFPTANLDLPAVR